MTYSSEISIGEFEHIAVVFLEGIFATLRFLQWIVSDLVSVTVERNEHIGVSARGRHATSLHCNDVFNL